MTDKGQASDTFGGVIRNSFWWPDTALEAQEENKNKASPTGQGKCQEREQADGVFFFFFWEITINLQAAARNDTEILCSLHPVSLSGYNMENYTTAS